MKSQDRGRGNMTYLKSTTAMAKKTTLVPEPASVAHDCL